MATQNSKKGEVPHLLIAIDPGASSIKVVGSLEGDSSCVPFTIDPYCLKVDDSPPSKSDFTENSVWVRMAGITYAIGNLAVAKYDCPLEIKPSKIDSIVPKVCAAIAVLHRKFNLPKYFHISLVSVLPPGEFEYEDRMRSELILAFRGIVTPAGMIKPQLKKLEICSEGYGVMSWHRNLGMAQNRDLGVIMFGFRNTSVLFSRKGEETRPKSSELGFYQVLEKISSTSGGNYPEAELIVPVWNYLVGGQENSFRRILRSANREDETRRIKLAVDRAMSEYKRNLESWLMGAMQPTDTIVMCGGNADYIGNYLNPFLEKYVEELPSGYPIFQHIGKNAIPPEIVETGMANRFLDIYCLWNDLNSSYKVEV
jgi:hypothetical protein